MRWVRASDLHWVTQQWEHVVRKRGDTSSDTNLGSEPMPARPAASPAPGWEKELLLVTSDHQWCCVMGTLPSLCFKHSDGVWISFKVGTKLVMKQNVANTIFKLIS